MKKIYKILTFMILISMTILTGCSDTIDLEKLSKKLSTYTMEIVYDGTDKLNVKQNLRYVNNTGVDLDHLYLHLYVNDFSKDVVDSSVVSSLNHDKAYYVGDSFSTLDFTNIMVDDSKINYSFIGNDKDIIRVDFDKILYNADNINIYFEYNITMPKINHRFGIGEKSINIANFYPIACVYEEGGFDTSGYHYNGDPFYSELANYNVNISVPTKYTLASTGSVKNMVIEGEYSKYDIVASVVRDFAIVLSDEFQVLEGNVGDTKISYYYYKNSYPEKCLKTAIDSVTTFENIIGDYPYDTLSVVEASFVNGGMEYPNLVYISDSVVDESDYINVIVHEIAHQWWYGIVGNDEYSYGWLDEGLTEYTTLLFYEQNPSYGVDVASLIKNQTNSYVTFVDIYRNVFDSVDTSMNRDLDEFDTEYEYVYIAYVKGMLFFDTLRDLVGDKRFMKAMADYFETAKFTFSTPDTLLASFEKSTGLSLKDFFVSWISGNVEIISIN